LAPYAYYAIWATFRAQHTNQTQTHFYVLVLLAFLSGTVVGIVEALPHLRCKLWTIPATLLSTFVGLLLGAVNALILGYVMLYPIMAGLET
jgi:hypothetical protein